MTQVGESVSSGAVAEPAEDPEIYLIAVGDRAVKNLLGIFYHYSLEYWRADVASVTLEKEWDVPDFEKEYAGAAYVAAVELRRESGYKVYEYKHMRRAAWRQVSVAASVIHQESTGANLMPIFQGDEATVKNRWEMAVAASKSYEYSEQVGFGGVFLNWPNSVYYGGNYVNNSNTFVRVMVDEIGLKMDEMKGWHPGRMQPIPVTTRYSSSPWAAGTTAPPKP